MSVIVHYRELVLFLGKDALAKGLGCWGTDGFFGFAFTWWVSTLPLLPALTYKTLTVSYMEVLSRQSASTSSTGFGIIRAIHGLFYLPILTAVIT